MERFDNEDDAIAWALEQSNFRFIQDVRFSFINDKKAMKEYNFLLQNGSGIDQFDAEVIVEGRKAKVGVTACP